MKHSTKFFLLFASILFACEGKKVETSTTEPGEMEFADSVEVGNTEVTIPSRTVQVVPTMGSIFPDINTVHCSNVEYLWNRLISNSDKDISNHPLAKIFSRSKSWMNSMDTAKLVLAFGKPSDVYESIIRQYKTKYGIERNDLTPHGDTFWAYTDKVVNGKYAEPFDEQPLLFLGTEVSAFGFNSEPGSSYAKDYFKEQFDILYVGKDNEFVVRLNPENTTDEIILVMLPKRGTFQEMFDKSKNWIAKGKKAKENDPVSYNLNGEDELIIPVIRFKTQNEYAEASGLEFSSKYGAMEVFEQAISFNFDRKGVVMESNVGMVDSVGAPQKPKMLHFDRPFYLYIKEKNASHPYFNLWVSDAEILESKSDERL